MSAIQAPLEAPPIVRQIGYYFLVLSGLGVLVLASSIVHGSVRWYQISGLILSVVVGIGLVRERRWAYVVALAGTGLNLAWVLGSGVIAVARTENGWAIAALAVSVNLAILALPLLLLGEPARSWFRARES
ncbi:MAG: hypothetical protein ACRDHM_02085 [Actinomycetota bacterium]